MDVAQTMVLAVVISMVIIWLFFGDIKGIPDRRKLDPDLHPGVPDPDDASGILLKRHHDERPGPRCRHDGR